jgi:multidrug efflux pump subunit AcrA (membrane-fusion protein)
LLGVRGAVAVIVLWSCGGHAREHGATEPVRTAAVARGKVMDRVLLTGELRAVSAIDLSVPRTDAWQLSIRWMAEDGVMVKHGDRVLEFDNSAFADQLEQKRLALIDAEMTFKGAVDLQALDTATKTTELRVHQIELEKATVKANVPSDLLTARDAQDRQLEKKRAEIAVQKAQQDLVAQKSEAALELQVKQIAVDKAKRAIDAADESIKALVITAPRDGVLVVGTHPWEGRKFHVGDTVEPGMAILSLPDWDKGLEVHAALSDVDDGRVAIGDTATCTLDAYPAEPIACALNQITPVARAESGRGSLRRTFDVTLELAKADAAHMRPGMSVKVEVKHAPVDTLVVPRGAIARTGESVDATVRLASGETRAVKLGACDEQGCAVTAGVSEGDKVRVGAAP